MSRTSVGPSHSRSRLLGVRHRIGLPGRGVSSILLSIPSPSSPYLFRLGFLQPRWYGLLLADRRPRRRAGSRGASSAAAASIPNSSYPIAVWARPVRLGRRAPLPRDHRLGRLLAAPPRRHAQDLAGWPWHLGRGARRHAGRLDRHVGACDLAVLDGCRLHRTWSDPRPGDSAAGGTTPTRSSTVTPPAFPGPSRSAPPTATPPTRPTRTFQPMFLYESIWDACMCLVLLWFATALLARGAMEHRLRALHRALRPDPPPARDDEDRPGRPHPRTAHQRLGRRRNAHLSASSGLGSAGRAAAPTSIRLRHTQPCPHTPRRPRPEAAIAARRATQRRKQ